MRFFLSIFSIYFLVFNLTKIYLYKIDLIIHYSTVNMNQNNQNQVMLLNLVTNFEDLSNKGEIGIYSKEEFMQLINFYNTRNDLEKALETIDIAISQFKYITKFYLVKSRLLIESNKPKQALKQIRYCEKISGYDFEVKLLKAKALSMMGKVESVSNLLEELKAFASVENRVDICLIKSYNSEYSGDYDNMFVLLKEALSIEPTNKEALDRIMSATLLTKKYFESVEFHEKLINENPYNYMAWFNVGQIYSILSEYEKAIDYIEYSFIIEPNFEDGYLQYSELCNQVGKYKNAVKIYEEYLEKFEADSELYTNLANSYVNLGILKKAKKYTYKSIETDPYNDEAYFLLGEIFKKQEKWQNALNAYHKAAEFDEYREEYLEALAETYFKLKEYDKSEYYFDELVSMDTPEEGYYIKYIYSLVGIEKYSKALQIVKKSEDIVYSTQIKYLVAVIYFKMNNRKEGLYHLDSALNDDGGANHKIFFDLAPEFTHDRDVISLIAYHLK